MLQSNNKSLILGNYDILFFIHMRVMISGRGITLYFRPVMNVLVLIYSKGFQYIVPLIDFLELCKQSQCWKLQ